MSSTSASHERSVGSPASSTHLEGLAYLCSQAGICIRRVVGCPTSGGNRQELVEFATSSGVLPAIHQGVGIWQGSI